MLIRCALLFMLGSLLAPLVQADDDAPPNIVLILSDDQGWDDYGFMDHPAIETPRLDQLAAQSRLYTRGYVAAPLCGPSLASILTGLHPHRHGFTSNDPPFIPGHGRGWPPERRAMRDTMIDHILDDPLLPALLAGKGYQSLQTGKWWMRDYTVGGFTHGMTHGDMDRGGRHGDEGLAIGRETMQPIWDFLDQTGDQPFLLWYAPMLPHLPHNPPQRLVDKYMLRTDSIHIANYWAMCEWWDETCGELLDGLDQRGLTDNTLVIYVCDNGWIPKADTHLPAPRSKTTPYEGGIRTPIMVRWPGRIAPQRDDTTLVSALDIVPTVLEVVGVAPPVELDGVSLLDTEALAARDAVFSASYTHNAVDLDRPVENLQHLIAIEGDWKLIWPAGTTRAWAPPELYDLAADPRETQNLAAAQPARVERLQGLIAQWWPEGAARASELPDLGETGGWEAMKNCALALGDGHLIVTATDRDPFMAAPLLASPEGPLIVKLRMKSAVPGPLEVYWATPSTPNFAQARRVEAPHVPGEAWADYTIEIPADGNVTRLRIDPASNAGEIRIDHIELLDEAGESVKRWSFD